MLYDESLDLEVDKLFDRIEALEEENAKKKEALVEKEKALSVKEEVIVEKDAEIERLKKALAELSLSEI